MTIRPDDQLYRAYRFLRRPVVGRKGRVVWAEAGRALAQVRKCRPTTMHYTPQWRRVLPGVIGKYRAIETNEGFRFVSYVNEIQRRLAKGYYADDYNEAVFRPAIWRTNNGRFVAGYKNTQSDVEGIVFLETAD